MEHCFWRPAALLCPAHHEGPLINFSAIGALQKPAPCFVLVFEIVRIVGVLVNTLTCTVPFCVFFFLEVVQDFLGPSRTPPKGLFFLLTRRGGFLAYLCPNIVSILFSRSKLLFPLPRGGKPGKYRTLGGDLLLFFGVFFFNKKNRQIPLPPVKMTFFGGCPLLHRSFYIWGFPIKCPHRCARNKYFLGFGFFSLAVVFPIAMIAMVSPLWGSLKKWRPPHNAKQSG